MSKRYQSLPCPDCNKIFSSNSGLKYHIEKEICKKKPQKKNSDQSDLTLIDSNDYRNYLKNQSSESLSKIDIRYSLFDINSSKQNQNSGNCQLFDNNIKRFASPKLITNTIPETISNEIENFQNAFNVLIDVLLIKRTSSTETDKLNNEIKNLETSFGVLMKIVENIQSITIQNNVETSFIQNNAEKSQIQNNAEKSLVQNCAKKSPIQNNVKKLQIQNNVKSEVQDNTQLSQLQTNAKTKSAPNNTENEFQNNVQIPQANNNKQKNESIMNKIINFGKEGSETELCKKMAVDIHYVLKNELSECVPQLIEIMHNGEKYPEYQNIYIDNEFPDFAFIWKNGNYVKVDKNKIINKLIAKKLDIFSEYTDTGENISDDLSDQYLDYREQIEDDSFLRDNLFLKINDILTNIGNFI